MLDWLRPRPKCPLDALVKEWLDSRLAWILEEFGTKRLRSRPLILPTDEFFPDPIEPTPECLEALMPRLAAMMDLDPHTVGLEYFTSRDFSNAAGVYLGRRDDGRYLIAINLEDAISSESLASTLVHELAHVHLLGHGHVGEDAPDHEILTDLLTVYFGFGILRANAAVYSRSWSTQGWGYYQWGKQGYLGMNEYAYALALLARSRDEHDPNWVSLLRLDVRAAFKKSLRYLQSPNALPPGLPTEFSDTTGIRLMMAGRKAGILLERMRFVCDAVEERHRLIEGLKHWAPLTAEHCCKAVETFAVEQFDVDARVTLEAWGLLTGVAVGETVAALIDANLIPGEIEFTASHFEKYGSLHFAEASEPDELFVHEE